MNNIAKVIKLEVTKYLSNKGFSCHHEVGLNKKGKLRADILSFNYKRKMIIVEVKSCWKDFQTDKKWKLYIPFCNYMYFAIGTNFEIREEFLNTLKQEKIGLLIVDLEKSKIKSKIYHSKTVTCQINPRYKKQDKDYKRDIIVRLAYRNGFLRTNKKNWIEKKL